MLGHWPLGTRPLGALRRQGQGPVYATLLVAGVSVMAGAATAQARSTVTSAGNGAASFTSNNGLGALSSAGIGAFAASMSAKASSIVTAAGIGTTSLKLSSKANSTLVANCTATFVPVMTAQASSNTSMQGSSTFGMTDSPASTLDVSGFGVFAAVGYALYLDAEKAGPAPEERRAYPNGDNRVAVAPFEDRVYYVKSKPLTSGPPNRRRTL